MQNDMNMHGCRMKCYKNISESCRDEIFEQFWETANKNR
jgi:hypothetical protein